MGNHRKRYARLPGHTSQVAGLRLRVTSLRLQATGYKLRIKIPCCLLFVVNIAEILSIFDLDDNQLVIRYTRHAITSL